MNAEPREMWEAHKQMEAEFASAPRIREAVEMVEQDVADRFDAMLNEADLAMLQGMLIEI